MASIISSIRSRRSLSVAPPERVDIEFGKLRGDRLEPFGSVGCVFGLGRLRVVVGSHGRDLCGQPVLLLGEQVGGDAAGVVQLQQLAPLLDERGESVGRHEERQSVNGRDLTARRLWLCQVRAGAIVEAVGYCSGEWDEELRARHADEAAMIRP